MNENQSIENTNQNQTSVNETTTPTVDQNLLPQSKVNELVGSAKQKGYEKGYQQAFNELNQQKQAPNSESPAPQQSQSVNDEDKMRKIAEEAARNAFETDRVKKANELAVMQFTQKISDAKSRYADYDDVIKAANFHTEPAFGRVLELVNQADNSGDVLYDLAKNRQKAGHLLTLSYVAPNLAMSHVTELSNSIKQNQASASQAKPNEPLGHPKPSNIGVDAGTSGEKSVSYYRNLHKGKR